MVGFSKSFADLTNEGLGWRIGSDEMRCYFFNIFEIRKKLIILVVRDDRRRLNIVEMIMLNQGVNEILVGVSKEITIKECWIWILFYEI